MSHATLDATIDELKIKLEESLQYAMQESGTMRTTITELTTALNIIHNAALPDPCDERDISLTWLVGVIQDQYKAVLRENRDE